MRMSGMFGANRGDADAAGRQNLPELILHWLLRDATRLQEFAAVTGYTPQAMMQDVEEALPMAVFEYLMNDETLLLQFCADTGTPPEECNRLWQQTCGGA